MISIATINRLTVYLRYLDTKSKEGIDDISSVAIADGLGLNAMVVKKDLSSISSLEGKPKVGFNVQTLIKDIKKILGYDNITDAVVVGAGKLGKALLSYDGFKNYGLNISAAFDSSIEIEEEYVGKKIFPMSGFGNYIKRRKIRIGIITVPVNAAQEVCDNMVNAGIEGIWNFVPAILKVPDGVAVKNEDMAAGLAVLSGKLSGIIN